MSLKSKRKVRKEVLLDVEAGCKYTGSASTTEVFDVVDTGPTTQGLKRIYPGMPEMVQPRDSFAGRK